MRPHAHSQSIFESPEDFPIPLREAAKVFQNAGYSRKPSIQTLRRWCDQGTRCGQLQALRIGGQRFVTIRSIREFIELSGLRQASPRGTPRAAAARAIKQLEARGA